MKTKTIEEIFRKWVEHELESGYSKQDIADAILDQKLAWEWWEAFSIWHDKYIIEFVTEHLKKVVHDDPKIL